MSSNQLKIIAKSRDFWLWMLHLSAVLMKNRVLWEPAQWCLLPTAHILCGPFPEQKRCLVTSKFGSDRLQGLCWIVCSGSLIRHTLRGLSGSPHTGKRRFLPRLTRTLEVHFRWLEQPPSPDWPLDCSLVKDLRPLAKAFPHFCLTETTRK